MRNIFMKLKDYIKQYGYDIGYEKFKSENKVSNKLLKYISKFGFIDGINKYIVVCNNNAQSLDNFIKKYGEVEGTKRYNDWKENCKPTLKTFIKKYGEVEGTKRYNDWKENCVKNRPITIEDYVDKYGEVEGTKRYNDWKKSLDNASLTSFIKKYGEVEGTKRYNEYVQQMSISVKSSMKPGIMKYINSKQFYVDKYGEVEGTKRYNDWKKSQDHGSLAFFIKKYGEEDGLKKYYKTNMLKTSFDKTYYSKISQELFKILENKLNNDNVIFYATKNHEISLYNEQYHEKYLYDFCYNKKIIEYNGDYWHANPTIYDENDEVRKDITAKQIWEYDQRKINFAKAHGYQILVIWDKDYVHDKIKIINICIDFLNT